MSRKWGKKKVGNYIIKKCESFSTNENKQSLSGQQVNIRDH